jgi:hypothetical protein
MNNATITLKDFFGLQELKLNKEQLKAASSKDVTQAIESALANLPGIGWQTVTDGLEKALAKAFNVGLAELLAATWSKWSELRKYLDEPEAVNYLRLAKHMVTSDHEPEVELLLNDLPLIKLKFKVIFELEIYGASLMIHEAMVRKVTAVSGKGSCKIKYEDYELFERESKIINLPGEVEFNPGIRISSTIGKARVTKTLAAI